NTHMKLCLLGIVLLLLSATAARAQFGFGSGNIVFDPTNFTKNDITAAQMLLQVANSDQEVAALLQNLIPVGGSWYGYAPYAALIREVLATVNRGTPMHYNLDTIDAVQQDVWRGYTAAQKEGDERLTSDLLIQTNLNAQRGALNTVHEELRPEDDDQVDGVLDDLQEKALNANGNMDLAQLNFYLAQLNIQEQRRQRHMLGALTQAITVQNQYRTTFEGWNKIATDELMASFAVEVPPYDDSEGVATFSER